MVASLIAYVSGNALSCPRTGSQERLDLVPCVEASLVLNVGAGTAATGMFGLGGGDTGDSETDLLLIQRSSRVWVSARSSTLETPDYVQLIHAVFPTDATRVVATPIEVRMSSQEDRLLPLGGVDVTEQGFMSFVVPPGWYSVLVRSKASTVAPFDLSLYFIIAPA